MFNATKLLGELMESRSAPSAAGRLHSALGQNRHGSGGLQSLLGGLNTGGFGGRAGTSSGANAGVGGLLGQLASSAQQAMGTAGREVRSNNPMAIGGLGALAGALMGGGKGAIGGGVMAVLGSLAYSALQNSGQGEAAAAATAPKTSEEVEANARLLLRAMISAAKADGQIDRKEMDRIMGKLREAGSDPEAQQFVLQEMSGPLDIEALAREVNSPHLAAEVYAASLLAIEVDTPAERQYLDDLARALKLPPQTTGYVRQQLGVGA